MDESWQDPLDTWKSRLLVLHDHKYMTDCSFVINNGPNKFQIKAHKLILAASSSEFLNLYFLCRAINYDEIIVRDVTPAALTSFVDYVYKETAVLTMDIIFDVLKLAKLYAVKSLERFCARYLESELNQENILTILDKTSSYGLDLIKPKCMNVLSGLTVEFYKEPAFNTISSETLKFLLSFDTIPGKEIEIYKAVVKWSEVKCEKLNIEKNPFNKRLFLQNCVDEIRFGCMTGEEFNICADDSILSKEEVFEVFRKTSRFSSQKRTNVTLPVPTASHYRPLLYFPSNTPNPYLKAYRTDLLLENKKIVKKRNIKGYSEITFSVDKPIVLYGIGTYGLTTPTIESNNFSKVTIELYQKTFISGYVQLRHQVFNRIQYDGTLKMHDFFLQKEIMLQPNTCYWVSISGDQHSELFNGENYCSKMKFKNVTFQVKEHVHDKRINSIYWKKY